MKRLLWLGPALFLGLLPLFGQKSGAAPAPIQPGRETAGADRAASPPAEAPRALPPPSEAARAAVTRMRHALLAQDAAEASAAAGPAAPSPPNSADPSAGAVPLAEPVSPLDAVKTTLRVRELPVATALRALGRPHGVAFVVAPDASDATVSADLADASLRTCLEALLASAGLSYEERTGFVTVRRNRTAYYTINYPAMRRTASGAVSVNLAASNQTAAGGAASPTGANVLAQSQAQAGTTAPPDSATLEIAKDSDSDPWALIAADLKQALQPGETIALNRFTGIAAISASDARHEQLRAFVALLNRRLNRQVHITARLVEVTISDASKLGIDWQQAATSVHGGQVTFAGSIGSNLASAGAATLPADVLGLRIGAGRLSSVLTALAHQGTVRTSSEPTVTTLTNQTTYIKIGEDKTFFSLYSLTSLNTAGVTGDPNAYSQEIYSRFTQTFGNVLEVTPTVGDDDVITLVAAPSISRLTGTVTSPDGKQSGPVTDSKATESIIRLKSGETAIMGGFAYNEDAVDQRGVPLLRRLPLIGRAFRTDATHNIRTELVILVTAVLDPL